MNAGSVLSVGVLKNNRCHARQGLSVPLLCRETFELKRLDDFFLSSTLLERRFVEFEVALSTLWRSKRVGKC